MGEMNCTVTKNRTLALEMLKYYSRDALPASDCLYAIEVQDDAAREGAHLFINVPSWASMRAYKGTRRLPQPMRDGFEPTTGWHKTVYRLQLETSRRRIVLLYHPRRAVFAVGVSYW